LAGVLYPLLFGRRDELVVEVERVTFVEER
jgi:hypothetical protein